jgi:hypothetical protein
MSDGTPGLIFRGGVVVLRGVVLAPCTQNGNYSYPVYIHYIKLYKTANLAIKLPIWLCVAKRTPPNTPDTPCLQVIRTSRVNVPFDGVLRAGDSVVRCESCAPS